MNTQPQYKEEAIPFVQLDPETNGKFILFILSNRVRYKRKQLRNT